MQFIRLILKSDKNVNDIIKKLDLKKKTKYSFCDYYHLSKSGLSINEENIIIRKTDNNDKYLFIKNKDGKVISRKEFDSLKEAKDYINNKYALLFEYKFNINKTGREYKNKDIRLWVDNIMGIGTVVSIKGENVNEISSLFDVKQSLIIPLEEYVQNIIFKIRGKVDHFRYMENNLDKNGILELTSFVLNRKRYLNDLEKINKKYLVVSLIVISLISIILILFSKNMILISIGIIILLLCFLIVFYYVYTFYKSKNQNKKYKSGTFEINDDVLSISYGKEGREFITSDIKCIYIGKYSLFILIKNSNLFFYFSILDKNNILEIFESNKVDVEIKELI